MRARAARCRPPRPSGAPSSAVPGGGRGPGSCPAASPLLAPRRPELREAEKVWLLRERPALTGRGSRRPGGVRSAALPPARACRPQTDALLSLSSPGSTEFPGPLGGGWLLPVRGPGRGDSPAAAPSPARGPRSSRSAKQLARASL